MTESTVNQRIAAIREQINEAIMFPEPEDINNVMALVANATLHELESIRDEAISRSVKASDTPRLIAMLLGERIEQLIATLKGEK